MKKYIFLILIFANVVFADVTNEQILKKIEKLEHNQELLKQEMKLRFDAVDERFSAIDKRFDAVDKRFDAVDKRFDAVYKQFETVDKRFEEVNKRFEEFNRRFETLSNFIMTLIAGIFGLMGFMMWDRRTVVEKAKKECVEDVEKSDILNKKADKEYVDRLFNAMNELLALKDETAKNVFKKYGLV